VSEWVQGVAWRNYHGAATALQAELRRRDMKPVGGHEFHRDYVTKDDPFGDHIVCRVLAEPIDRSEETLARMAGRAMDALEARGTLA
jgi:hypothetical protein